ncbi:MAG: hypothetical protein Kow0092_35330 [Deferrisomatales bacterium]
MRKSYAVIALCAVALGAAPAAAATQEGKSWKTRAEASYVRTDGNADTETLAGKAEYSLDQTPNRYFAGATALFGKTDGEKTASRWTLGGRYERTITDRLFGFVEANSLRDTFSGYDARINLGPGVGYEFLKYEGLYLKGLASGLYAYDNFSEGGSDSYASGKLAADFWWQILENLKLTQKASYLVSFDDTQVSFFDSETGLEVQVNSHVALGVGYVVNYQNEPPGDAKKTDTRFLTSLIVTY